MAWPVNDPTVEQDENGKGGTGGEERRNTLTLKKGETLLGGNDSCGGTKIGGKDRDKKRRLSSAKLSLGHKRTTARGGTMKAEVRRGWRG